MYKLSLRNQIIQKINQMRKQKGYNDDIFYKQTPIKDLQKILIYMVLENTQSI